MLAPIRVHQSPDLGYYRSQEKLTKIHEKNCTRPTWKPNCNMLQLLISTSTSVEYTQLHNTKVLAFHGHVWSYRVTNVD